LKKRFSTKIKAAFIDRDGTINEEKNYAHKIEDFALIPGSLEALRLLSTNGIKIYIITNQAGIAKGYFTEEQFHTLTEHMLSQFKKEGIKIEKVLYCPHHPEGVIPQYTLNCLCRKPHTKLIEDVIEQEKFALHELVLIGDKNSDIEAGIKMGINTYLVLTGYGNEHQASTKATYIKQNLLSAVQHIFQNQ
jgi:D-glycero-D-manno-heptose 1,7-bisphosphate phosphatase